MSLGRLTASIASGTQDTTVALAAINFDFSVFKTEAPTEYKPLGSALSSHRKAFAEDGEIHTTARKLRALFEEILPRIPSLYRVYGKRASEIAKNSQLNAAERLATGAFAELSGLDGGSVWAAATSGPGAIAVHLLACMLAKIWSAPEATSIWVEIVSLRKQKLMSLDENDPKHVYAFCAAKCTLSRQELADWDASARAWLRAADDTFRVQQRQLKLIVDNIDLPVNTKMNVYDSVMAAWLPAMTVLDKLIDGMPYSIENSSILLALSAWHLFPNMSVLSNTSQFVKQDDPLLDARGILTLGLQSVTSAHQRQSPDDITRGITWSLPLAHYKYYGGPVETEKSLNTDGSRLSMAQFVQLALGSYFSGWKEYKFGAVDAALLIQDIWNCVTKKNEARFLNQHIPSSNSWLAIMANGAKEFSKSENSVRTEYTRLFNYGKRRCPQLIGLNDRTPSPIATLRRPEVLLGFPKTAEGRIYLLRQVAQRLGCEPKAMLIRYAMAKPEGRKAHFGLASVVPMQSSRGGGSTKVRWEPDTAFKEYSLVTLRDSIEFLKESDIVGPMTTGRQFIWNNAPSHYSKQRLVDVTIDEFFGMFAELALFGKSAGAREPRRAKGVPFELLFGDPHTAAIYTLASEEKPAIDVFGAQDVRMVVTDETTYRLQSSIINHLADMISDEGSALTLSRHVKSLKTLSIIHKIYNDLPGAKIAMRATSGALHEAKWVPDTDLQLSKLQKERERRKVPNERMETPEELKVQLFQAYEPVDLDLATTFACIAYFESGNINLSKDGLDNVMAMSSGDSLFIANALLSDPATVVRSNVTRIRGNVGKAGIALLVPPQQVMTREPQARDWNFLDYDNFDGVITDSFKATTLHMSFTDFILPIDVGTRIRDLEVYFLETVISVHDKGEWIGDLDIIPIAKNPLLRVLPLGTTCKRHKANNINIEDLELINVDSWKEFFDRPEESVVFRAKGNWMARLAASSISVTQGHLTLMFGEHICWGCGMEERDRLRHKAHPIFLL